MPVYSPAFAGTHILINRPQMYGMLS